MDYLDGQHFALHKETLLYLILYWKKKENCILDKISVDARTLDIYTDLVLRNLEDKAKKYNFTYELIDEPVHYNTTAIKGLEKSITENRLKRASYEYNEQTFKYTTTSLEKDLEFRSVRSIPRIFLDLVKPNNYKEVLGLDDDSQPNSF